MISTRVFILAGAIAAGVTGLSAPALADYVQLGAVNVSHQLDRSQMWDRFGGRMEGLRLRADGSDIFCRAIRVIYGNGQTQNVFSGALPQDRPVNIDLAGGTRYLRNITLDCRSLQRSSGRIFVMADVGRYRSEWMSSRDWNGYWSHIFNWGAPSAAPVAPPEPDRDWVELTREHFVGRGDRERDVTGWAAHHVDRIGLKPLDGDARCPRAVVTFRNNERQDLGTGRYDVLQRGRLYQFDLPGGTRDIQTVNLVCHAIGDYDVSIAIMTRK